MGKEELDPGKDEHGFLIYIYISNMKRTRNCRAVRADRKPSGEKLEEREKIMKATRSGWPLRGPGACTIAPNPRSVYCPGGSLAANGRDSNTHSFLFFFIYNHSNSTGKQPSVAWCLLKFIRSEKKCYA